MRFFYFFFLDNLFINLLNELKMNRENHHSFVKTYFSTSNFANSSNIQRLHDVFLAHFFFFFDLKFIKKRLKIHKKNTVNISIFRI